MKPAEEEEDVLDALGALASFASQQQSAQDTDQDIEARDDEDDDDDQPFTRKPFTRTMQKQERDALQKWVQCAKCAKWRKVPFTLKDEDISEDWECKHNKWDRMYAACTMAQALTDEEIDGILAGQQDALEARPLPPVELETAETDNTDLQPEASKQIPNRSRPSRNKTKKVIGGATDEEIAEHAARTRPTRPAAIRQLQRNRPKASARNGKMRAGKNINDAAEALLGMGSGFVDDDMMGDDDGDENGEDGEGSAFSSGSFRPGRVVWAKVDGHEWWPAKVVRRRAVPREVGPPPGGPTLVHTQIPVVFFTQSGVPGEVTDVLASSHGPVDVCTQAMAHLGGDNRSDSEEAEYAWLSMDSLKPFREGDSSAFEEDKHISDPTLKACIAAAERAVKTAAAERAVKTAADRAAAAAADAEQEGEDVNEDSQSDSDGGWGYTHVDLPGTPRGAQRGRHRPPKPRKGRALKGNRKAKGKPGRAGWDDEDEPGVSELPPVDPYGRAPGVPLAAPVVEGIFGWRWPISQHDLDRETRSQDVELAHEGGQDQGQLKSEQGTSVSAAAAGHASAQHDGLQQEEADAVAALLAAASGLSSEDMNASTPYPSGSAKDAQYLVKYIGKAHIHNEWVPEPLLLKIAKRKVINFKRRYGSQPCSLAEPAWTQPGRFICRRPCLSGPGWEVLVKWCDLGYEHATWEMEGEGELVQAQNQKLHQELWQRQKQALLRSQPEAAEAAAAAKEAAMTHMPSLPDHPAWIQRGQLYPHQLQAVSWLREQWIGGLNAVLADEKGLGRTATVITFLQYLRSELHCPGPVLVAMQASELRMWEGEWEFWGGQGLHVVSYSGSAAARTVIYEHELWLSPGCLDGKAPKRLKGDIASKVVQPDVVLVTYDALTSDMSQLAPIEWEAIAVDERNRVQPSLAKAHQALRELDANFRLLLPSGNPTKASHETLAQSLYFVDPEAVPDQEEDTDAQQQHQEDMRKALEAHMLRRTRSEVSNFVPPTAEVVLPVMMTQRQRECYQAHLARAYEVLTDPKTPRQNSHRGGQLRAVCASLKKVCDHPFLLADFEQAGSGASDPLSASGKLVVLDKLLRHLHTNNHKVLLLSRYPKVLEIVAAHFRQRLAAFPLEHIEASASAAARHDAIKRFNANGMGVLVMSTKSCGLGTNLPHVDTIILHDSDWNPRWDVQALLMAHCIGSADHAVAVYRLVTKGTLEERVHQLADKKKGSDLVFKSSHSKSSPAAVHMMEDALKWGAEHIFSRHRYHTEAMSDANAPSSASRPASAATPGSSHGDVKMEDAASPRSTPQDQEATTPVAAAAAEAAASPHSTPPASGSPEPGMQSPFGAPEQQQQPQQRSTPKVKGSHRHGRPVFQPVYTGSIIDKLVHWTASLPAMQAQARPSNEASADHRMQEADEPGPADRAVQSAGEVLGSGWECVKLHEWSQAQLDDEGHGEEGEDEDGIDEIECADVGLHGDDSPARGEPSGSNAKFWEGLLKEKHEQLLKEEEQQVREQWQTSHVHHVDTSPALDPAEEAGGQEYGEEAEEEEGLGPRQSSGLSHLEYGGEDLEANKVRKNRRQIKASGRAVGKTNRRRRLDEEDEQAEEIRATRKRKRGAVHDFGRPAVDRAEVEALQHEWQHQEDVMQRIADASTPEGHVAHKAYRRIGELVDELKLDEGHTELAQQTAEILMMLRPEGEAASDFQDYTLVAVIAVAAHLCGTHVGDHHFIAALAQRFSQDTAALQQVFEYILSTVARFRHSHTRMMTVLGEHVMSHGRTYSAGLPEGQHRQAGETLIVRVDSERPSRPASAEHHHAVAQPPSVIMNSDMEAFGNRLNAIVNADFYAAALAVGPVDVPLGPLQALSAHLPADNTAQAAHTEEILKQLRQMQEQVALFDRIHNIRVKHIQEEYQKYMERVRSKAQSAIDQANANYQHHRAMLTARVDAMVHYLQQQYLRGPTSGVYQEADRLQQLQQQQLQQHQQQQQQQQQQQRSADSEALQLNASLTPVTAASDPSVNPGPMQTAQDPAGEQEAGKPTSSQSVATKTTEGSQDRQPAEQRGSAEEEAEAAPTNGPTTSASGMSLQPPSLPSHFSQQRPQQPLPVQIVAGSAQAQQQAGAVAAGAASPRDAGLQGLAGQKQAPKPPLAPGSKSLPQHVLLARQLNQPAQHLPLKGLSPQQQSQVLSQYNHDQQRSTAPMQAMQQQRAGSMVLAGHPTREVPSQTVHAIFQQGGLQQAIPKSKLGAGTASPTPLASLVTSQPHPHPYPHGITVQSGAPSMVPPSHPKPIQTGPSGDSFLSGRTSDLARQSSQQVKVMREASPSHATTDIRINGDSADAAAERPSPSSAAGAASYGASTMGITIQPSQRLLPGSHSDDDSMGESSPSGSPSAGREGVTSLPVQLSTNAFAAAAAAAALPVQQTAVSPRRVSILRGGPVAGLYIDGRQVTTGSGELPAHIGHGLEADERYGRAAAVRKAEAARYAALSASKADSGPGRAMHASPARLIITSGGSLPARDSPLAPTASGDLNRASSGSVRAQHTQRAPSISVVTAPEPGQAGDQAEGLLHRQRQGSPQRRDVQSASMPGQAAPGQAAPLRPDTVQTSLAEAQMASAYAQQYGMALSQQHAHTVGDVNAGAVHVAPVAGHMTGSPFPARVDSLSHWARQREGQQLSSTPQPNSFADSQSGGSLEFEQGRHFHHTGDQET